MPWIPLPDDPEHPVIDSLILAVHAAFIDFDTIVFFGGDEFDPDHSTIHDFHKATCLFDCNTLSVTRIESPDFDTFCSGHALTVSGNLVVAGGTDTFPQGTNDFHGGLGHFSGLRDAAVFRLETDGTTHKWIHVHQMNFGRPRPGASLNQTGGRWYPTLITLASGHVLAVGGHPEEGDVDHANVIPEIYTPEPSGGGTWHRLGNVNVDTLKFSKYLTTPGQVQGPILYPRLHLLPTGDVFSSTPADGKTISITIDENNWGADFNEICDFNSDIAGTFNLDGQSNPTTLYDGHSATSILLPLLWEEFYSPRVLICGAEQAQILDLKGWKPGSPLNQVVWGPTGDRKLNGSPRRMNGNSVILLTGQILLIGGVEGVPGHDPQSNDPTLATLLQQDKPGVLSPEIFNPFSNEWEDLDDPDPAEIVRNYHSVALLMPDGRVWTAGSDHNAGAGVANAVKNIRIYEPWYYGNPNRPSIIDIPDRIFPGTEIVIRSTQASDLKRVAAVRCGSCTHAFNSDQRFVDFEYKFLGDDMLLVNIPSNPNIMPPGVYFFATINNERLPSIGVKTYMNPEPHTKGEDQWKDLTDAPNHDDH